MKTWNWFTNHCLWAQKFTFSKVEIPALLKSAFTKYRKPILIGSSLIALLLVLVIYHKASAPIHKLREWKDLANQAIEKPQFARGMDSLQRQIAFKQALLALPKTDSMHLVLNVPDSTLGLFVNGISIYKTKLTALDLDPLLKGLSEGGYYSQFSKPLTVTSSRASIEKEPIIEKTAPKTQEEFLASVTMPDSVVYDPAFIHLALENGMDIFIGLNEISNQADRKAERQFYASERKRNRNSLLKSVFTFKALEYRPEIYLEAANAEITSIYRALPEQPKVVIFYY